MVGKHGGGSTTCPKENSVPPTLILMEASSSPGSQAHSWLIHFQTLAHFTSELAIISSVVAETLLDHRACQQHHRIDVISIHLSEDVGRDLHQWVGAACSLPAVANASGLRSFRFGRIAFRAPTSNVIWVRNSLSRYWTLLACGLGNLLVPQSPVPLTSHSKLRGLGTSATGWRNIIRFPGWPAQLHPY